MAAKIYDIYCVETAGSPTSALVVLKVCDRDRYLAIFTSVAQGENLYQFKKSLLQHS